MHYNLYERRIAKVLDSHPFLRMAAKATYQRVSYLLSAELGKKIQIHAGCSLYGIADRKEERAQYFFGYYDKSPWSDCGRYYLTHLFNDRDRSKIGFGLYDCLGGSLRQIGFSSAFNFQQGAMLQWLRDGSNYIIVNAVQDQRLVATIIDPFSNKIVGKLPVPVQTIKVTADEALTLNYKRLNKIKPEYGYSVAVTNYSSNMDYTEDGIWRISIKEGSIDLILTLQDLIEYYPRKDMKNSAHKINHIMYSPSGHRFVFMHRWIGPNGKYSRLYTANSDGSNLYLLADDQMVSHYCWKDDEHLLAWARQESKGDRYYLFTDKTNKSNLIGEDILDIYGDGHPSYSPDGRWIVTDTYPDKARMRYLLLFDTSRDKLTVSGRFFAPWRFDGTYRCDLHPRWSPEGTKISIDSAHEGFRNSYILNIADIIERA